MRFVVPVFVMLLMSIGLKPIINESDSNFGLQSLEFVEDVQSRSEDATPISIVVQYSSNEIESDDNISVKMQ